MRRVGLHTFTVRMLEPHDAPPRGAPMIVETCSCGRTRVLVGAVFDLPDDGLCVPCRTGAEIVLECETLRNDPAERQRRMLDNGSQSVRQLVRDDLLAKRIAVRLCDPSPALAARIAEIIAAIEHTPRPTTQDGLKRARWALNKRVVAMLDGTECEPLVADEDDDLAPIAVPVTLPVRAFDLGEVDLETFEHDVRLHTEYDDGAEPENCEAAAEDETETEDELER